MDGGRLNQFGRKLFTYLLYKALMSNFKNYDDPLLLKKVDNFN